MLVLTKEQQISYNYYIKMRDKVKLVITDKNFMSEHTPFSEVLACVDVTGINHCLFIQNDAWMEYLDARKDWLGVEPEFRNVERLRASRGDYGREDDWDAEHVEKDYKEL